MKSVRRVFNYLFLIFVTLILVWGGSIFLISHYYVNALLHPPCVYQIQDPPAGFLDQAISLPSGEVLKAWWHPPLNELAVLVLGGHGSSRDSLMWEAEVLARHGFGALSVDSRVCVGLPATLGVQESEDAWVVLEWMQSQPEVKRVAVLGFSAGGVAGLRLAVRNPQVAAVITEGNYPSLQEEVLETPPAKPFSLRWQLQYGVAFMLERHLRTPIETVRPIEDLANISPRPVLLIFGEKEVQDTRALDQFHAAKDPKMLWIVPSADHGQYKTIAPQEYEALLIHFLNQTLQTQP